MKTLARSSCLSVVVDLLFFFSVLFYNECTDELCDVMVDRNHHCLHVLEVSFVHAVARMLF